MKLRLMCAALAVGLLGSSAQAADLAAVTQGPIQVQTRVQTQVRVQPTRAIARLVNQGLGYSVLHEAVGAPQSAYRVHVTCTIDESFVQTYCPTRDYVSSCPNATIVCR
jgi:hypothetical protein